MDELRQAIKEALSYLEDNNVDVPIDLAIKMRVKGIKADYVAGDLSSVNASYHNVITEALGEYFNGASVSSMRKLFKQAMINAFGDAYDLGWTDGGQDLPIDDEDALSWLEARMNQEAGYIDMLFQEAKELRKDEDFDYFSWITQRADGYTNTLREVYNNARLRAMKDQMVTFEGNDGAESCATCTMLKGSRHKISWFVKRNYVPPFGSSLECSKGGHCQHGLMNDKGDWITV